MTRAWPPSLRGVFPTLTAPADFYQKIENIFWRLLAAEAQGRRELEGRARRVPHTA